MRRLPILRTYGAAWIAVARNAHWLLLCALPFLISQGYVMLLTEPFMRVAFVNSFLKPIAGPSQHGFDVEFGGPKYIIPGPGYDFSTATTLAFCAFGLVALTVFAIATHRRVSIGINVRGEGWVSITSFLTYMAGAVALMAPITGFLLTLNFFMPQANAAAHAISPGMLAWAVWIAAALLGSWVLVKLGIILAAVAVGDRNFWCTSRLQTLFSDFWRTIGLICVIGITFELFNWTWSLIEWRFFRLGSIPFSFDSAYVCAMAGRLLSLWLQLAFSLSIFTLIYAHYRSGTGTAEPDLTSP
jgi:hypothetical protein